MRCNNKVGLTLTPRSSPALNLLFTLEITIHLRVHLVLNVDPQLSVDLLASLIEVAGE